jgi:hypothetical protein
VSLRFDGVQDLQLNGFNNQNAVSGIAFNEIGSPAFPEPSYEIVFEGAHGVEATFRCREVMVVWCDHGMLRLAHPPPNKRMQLTGASIGLAYRCRI